MEEFIGSIQLGVGHSLILGHVPPVVDPRKLTELISEQSSADMESFGLWESSSPNYSTYYPDVKPEDLKPSEDEFITPTFRLLSEVIVYKGVPIDFTKKGVLRKSMSKLLGQTINIDHEIMVGNAIGAVSKVYWQDSYKAKNGVIVPAGINGILKIDGKSNPRIARGIMMEPPSIHSNSVSVRYKWQPSHEFEDSSEFYSKVGTYNEDGELIRCVVSEILTYSETSLVSHGADPFAQKVEDGEIINPEYAANNVSFSADKMLSGHVFYDIKEYESDFKMDAAIPKQPNNNNNTTKIRMEELIKQLTTELGFKDGDLTKENLAQKITESFAAKQTIIDGLESSVSDLESEKDELDTQLSELQGKYDTLESNSTEAAEALKLTREEATRLIKLVKGEKADSSILEMIAGADLKMAAAFVKQYRTEAEEKFSATCNKCGSDDVTRSSGKSSKDGLITDPDDDEGGKNTKEKSNAEVIAKFQAGNKRKSRIFGNDKD